LLVVFNNKSFVDQGLDRGLSFAALNQNCYIERSKGPLSTGIELKNMTSTRIPGEESCIALLERYRTPEHIILHSKKVWEVGRVLGLELIKKNLTVDMDLIRASCLLHDVGKYPCILDGTKYHDVRGEQILEQEGFPDVARIVVQHVILRSSLDDPIAEEHVLFYADKRVVHDAVVSLEERFDYLESTYGKTPLAIEGLRKMKENTFRLENRLFLHFDFGPDDLINLMDGEPKD
jgi:uncharacterized protein